MTELTEQEQYEQESMERGLREIDEGKTASIEELEAMEKWGATAADHVLMYELKAQLHAFITKGTRPESLSLDERVRATFDERAAEDLKEIRRLRAKLREAKALIVPLEEHAAHYLKELRRLRASLLGTSTP